MYIYNTTFNIETNIVEQCLNEIEFQLIPKLIETGLFEKVLLTEILNQTQLSAQTFSLQSYCTTKTHLRQFQNFHNYIIENWVKKYNSQVVFFQTSMRVINQNNL
ncbi:DUF4286 family protein [Flavobacterium sp. CS20]|jgi:hypothetical protein|uniref:DUF4286 family protein n=1 Tax=Flavobacterium sp. CS20 TaxID=2775246 RepID=UPI001B3A2EE9|nr:DUF4286 family protein [Flavobacterium sp. CS20]QTY26657.1 DUF4286 family protein [Flavobacterium sp. CS20]